MPDWKSIVRSRIHAADADEDLVEEISQHAEELYRSLRARGRSDAEACASVNAEMRSLEAAAGAARARRARRIPAAPESPAAARSCSPLTFWRDIVHGARSLRARPAFATVAILTLALGIGANTAIFSVLNALLLQTLPFPEPDRLVMAWECDADDPASTFIVSAPNWQDWGAQSTSFESLGIWEILRFNIAGDGEPEQVRGLRMSASTFDVFGVRPQVGRTFTSTEDAPGHRVVVISDALWRRRYGGGPHAVGSTMRLNGEPHEIIGVMPPSFVVVSAEFAVWVPIAFSEQDAGRGSHSFFAAGRLKRGVPFDTARAEMDAIGRRLALEHPGPNHDESATITRMADWLVADLKTTLLALQGAVALVLLIACVNVANLLLAQASVRRRELGVRAALGATRGRLASLLLAEGLLLSLAGALAGLFVAMAGTAALAGAAPRYITRAPFRTATVAEIDLATLIFTLGVAVLTGVLFSLAPMPAIARQAMLSTLKTGGGRGGTAPLTLFRSTLVAVEVGLAVVVLAAAGLMIKSVMRLASVPPGLDPQNVVVMDMALPQLDFYGPPVRTAFCEDLQREVGAVPGVRSVSAISHLPLSGANAGRGLAILGRPEPPPGEGASAAYRLVCPGYFQTLGIGLSKGRDFAFTDSIRAPRVAIVNEAMARHYWPDGDPIGEQIKLGRFDSDSPPITIVGVARDVRHFGLEDEPHRELFLPYGQAAWPSMTIAVKSALEPTAVVPPIRAALARIDREQPVTRVRTMQAVMIESMGPRHFPMLLLASFAVIALVLAAIGVYGVVSYVVSQRTREIGIRLALGARAGQVIRLMLGRALAPVAVGLALGIAGALATSRLLRALLFQVQPGDPAVLGAIAAALALTAVTASFVPARRAAGVDPNVVLKAE